MRGRTLGDAPRARCVGASKSYPLGSTPVTRDDDTAAWELSLVHESLAQIEADVATAHRVLRYE